MNCRQRTYAITSQIPKGKVLTYKSLAILASVPNPRLVGLYLHQNPYSQVPCHRVINAKGEVAQTFAFGGGNSQKQRLQSENITFTQQKVNLGKFLWQPTFDQVKKLQNLLAQDFDNLNLNELRS